MDNMQKNLDDSIMLIQGISIIYIQYTLVSVSFKI